LNKKNDYLTVNFSLSLCWPEPGNPDEPIRQKPFRFRLPKDELLHGARLSVNENGLTYI